MNKDHMKEAMFPDFASEEYELKMGPAADYEAAGIDALLLSNQENLRYFAGFHEGAWCCKHFYFFFPPVGRDHRSVPDLR